jgi:hypothetical protein
VTKSTGVVYRMKHITRGYVRDHPDVLFMFGDNMAGRGFGGQAKAMRGEPNAVGVPTKWKPSWSEDAYFKQEDAANELVKGAILKAFMRVQQHLRDGGDVVIPTDGIGTGRADLINRAPAILHRIQVSISYLETTFRERSS